MNSLPLVAGPYLLAAVVVMVIGARPVAWAVIGVASAASLAGVLAVGGGLVPVALALVAGLTAATMATDVPDAVRTHRFGPRTATVVAVTVPAWFAVAAAVIVEPGLVVWLAALAWLPVTVLVLAGRGPGARVAASAVAAASLIGLGLIGIGALPSDGGGVLAASLGIVLAMSPVAVILVSGAVARAALPVVAAVPLLTASGLLTTVVPVAGEFGGSDAAVVVLAAVAVWALGIAPCVTVAPGGWAALALAAATAPASGGDTVAAVAALTASAPLALVVAVLAWAVTRVEALVGSARFDTVPTLRRRAPSLAALVVASSLLAFAWVTSLAWSSGIAVLAVVGPIAAWALVRVARMTLIGGSRPLVAGAVRAEPVAAPWIALAGAVALVAA